MAKNPEIARTILAQMGGSSRLQAMVNAKHLLDLGDGLSFKFARSKRGAPNYIKVRLTPADLYDVEFGSIHGYDYTVKTEHSNVHAEQLNGLFESETGLYLSL